MKLSLVALGLASCVALFMVTRKSKTKTTPLKKKAKKSTGG
jgi:hypothetical protein